MTNTSEKNFWLSVESLLRALLNKYAKHLDSESIDVIQHYLEHSEYEMAFEGMFIELMKAGVSLDESESAIYLNLGKELGLDGECIFDVDFWEKFHVFLSVNSTSKCTRD